MPTRRRRSESTSESDRTKRRGRPRVDKADASPSDRRRTQIRVAQRAYRQRKEGTLDGLRKRVSDLTNTIETMNSMFGDCRDRLFTAGVMDDQMRDLCNVAGQFDALIRDIRSPGDDCSSASAQVAEPDLIALDTADVTQSEVTPQASEAASWLDESALAHSNKWHGGHICTAPLGYEMENDAIVFGPQVMASHNEQLLPSSGTNHLEALLTVPPNTTLPPIFQPRPPSTYNFQESTFARRIFRAVVETAYDALANPAKRPSDYERIFRLVLSQEGRLNRGEVLAVLGKMLSKGHYEELNNWNAPLLHPGGAGTHYAPRDAYGNLQPKRTIAQLDGLGTDQSVLLDGVAHRKRSTEPVIRVPGFEGEWLDPYDVQGYLEEKCIFIDSSASFIEAEITEQTDMTPSGFNDSLNRVPETPSGSLVSGARSTPLDPGQLALLKQLNANLNRWNESGDVELSGLGMCGTPPNPLIMNESVQDYLAAGDANGYDSWYDMSIDQLKGPMLSDSGMWDYAQLPVTQPRSKNVVIDVTKFVQVLVVSGVCLGRSPGFRRKDVDRALAISSFDTF